MESLNTKERKQNEQVFLVILVVFFVRSGWNSQVVGTTS